MAGPYHVGVVMTALPGYDEALARILKRVAVLGTQTLPLGQARGRILRQELIADRDQPPFDRSTMDGFAVRSTAIKAGVSFKVIGTVAAGAPAGPSPDPSAGVVRIATGAAVPPAYDAVIPIEQAIVEGSADAERVRFAVDRVERWQNVHQRASDASAGQGVLPAGIRLGPQHLGIAAAVGAATVTVTRLPRITLLTTGDEVRDPKTATAELQAQQIRNSNGPMLSALVQGWGGQLMKRVHVPDDPDQTLAVAREALGRSNLVITVGGVSVGQRDLLPTTWKRLALQTLLHGVRIQPGKPLLAALDPAGDQEPTGESEKWVLGLPGNPVSVLVTAHLFVWPVLQKMAGLGLDAAHRGLGAGPGALPWRTVKLATPAQPSAKRQVFRAARFVDQVRSEVELIPWQGSGDLVHTATADGLLRLPIRAEPMAAGTELPLLPMAR